MIKIVTLAFSCFCLLASMQVNAFACDPVAQGTTVNGWSKGHSNQGDACPAAQTQADIQCKKLGGDYAACSASTPTQEPSGTWQCELSGCTCWKRCKTSFDPISH